uniref:Uncharacterized protein n=1 Tax=Amphimedon queenslandica TaxID=400682 RepID=A0A1X7UDN7_AMPQE
MINALHSSKDEGTKQFMFNGLKFGWSTIKAMYYRECERAKQGLTRMVPKMKEVYIIRDSWTMLNVAPVKIMQQEQVMSEIFRYITEHPVACDSPSAAITLKYLEDCNKLCEKDFQRHERITDINSGVLKSIDEGFNFFVEWSDEILRNDPNFDHSSSLQRSFLAWQSYFISPLRLSGSAVESLFSQYKHNANRWLDAANFAMARAKLCATDSIKPP